MLLIHFLHQVKREGRGEEGGGRGSRESQKNRTSVECDQNKSRSKVRQRREWEVQQKPPSAKMDEQEGNKLSDAPQMQRRRDLEYKLKK